MRKVRRKEPCTYPGGTPALSLSGVPEYGMQGSYDQKFQMQKPGIQEPGFPPPDAPASEKCLVYADSVQIGYGKKMVAQGVHFSLHAGEILALVGPNGCGKSTLLKTIAGFLPLQGGTLLLNGKKADRMGRPERAKFLSVVTTLRPDAEWMRVWDVAASGRYPFTGRLGILSEEDRQIVEEALQRLKASDLKERYFNELSDGQKQRVLLAKSIAQRPKLLILDEPTSFLDIRYQLEFMQIARSLAKEDGMALLMSLHEISIARILANRILTLKDGRQDASGSADLLTEEYVRELYEIPEDLSMGGIDGI